MALATLAAARTQYLANSSYDSNASTAEAILFIEACRALLLLTPASSGDPEGHALSMRIEEIRGELDRATAFLQQAQTVENGGSGVVHYSLQEFRQ